MGVYTAAFHDYLVLPARALITRGREQVLRLQQRPVSDGVAVQLVIDTGSRRSTLLPSVLADLNPALLGPARVETSLATGRTELFWVRLEFPGTRLTAIPELAVARLALPPSLRDFHGIVGRDLLGRWESLLMEGRRMRFSIRDTPRRLLGWLRR
jgi:hypothetical protein